MAKGSLILVIMISASVVQAQDTAKKYPWQYKDTNCTEWLTYCWYGSDVVSNPEVTAYGNRWVSQDKEEKPLEWVTEVRCVRELHVCILARNEKLIFGGGSQTNIDLYFVKEWSEFQIRAVAESDFPSGKECEIDTLLLNRADASVSVLSVPGAAAATKRCMSLMKPKTVMYTLELGNKQIQKEKP